MAWSSATRQSPGDRCSAALWLPRCFPTCEAPPNDGPCTRDVHRSPTGNRER
jgi:hypothetical protein